MFHSNKKYSVLEKLTKIQGLAQSTYNDNCEIIISYGMIYISHKRRAVTSNRTGMEKEVSVQITRNASDDELNAALIELAELVYKDFLALPEDFNGKLLYANNALPFLKHCEQCRKPFENLGKHYYGNHSQRFVLLCGDDCRDLYFKPIKNNYGIGYRGE